MLADTKDGYAIVKAAGRVFRIPAPGDRKQNSSVVFIISADLIEISRSPSAENSIPATFRAEEFIGSVVTLFFEAEGGAEFRVQKQQRDVERLAVRFGDTVHLTWLADDSVILP